ncbi:acyl-CoA dehydrogenase family protein [uncultured Williamsia sp.]|uniref:acyl-CoA dehydrogenase family protein n=1 Tax=uncultured Williamsia sp. TaxID=259311 RepID=UPI00260D67EA|nr:acyl-CoA dehydrogenase family protein [uncultured Williamsia sp.]
MTVATRGFALDDEQRQLRDAVRAFLDRWSDEEATRRAIESDVGYDAALWRRMSDDLGVQAIGIPEEYGGVGSGAVELGIVAAEMGRAVHPAPFLGSVVSAAQTLLASGDEQACRDLLPAIASGDAVATLAFTEESGRWDMTDIATRAEDPGDGWQLRGTKMFVLHGASADVVLVLARTPAGPSLFVVDDVGALDRRVQSTSDPTRRVARIDLDGAAARLVGEEGAAEQFMPAVLDLAAAVLAAEQVGGATRCLEMCVEYASIRKQFGKAIGSFQAIRHRLADLHLQIECARGVVDYALGAVDDHSDAAPGATALAKATASDAFLQAASTTIQVHGAIGFTWDHPAHLYYKRAVSSGQLLGDAARHRELLARHLGI